MDQVHVIRHKVLVEGQSQRRVAREMDLSRNTIRKYLQQSEPKRTERMSRARPVLERVRVRLEELIEEWSDRSTPKQTVTGTRLREQLLAEGYSVGTSLVREQLQRWRRQRQEVYVPLVHRAGDEAQVDFFEVTVEVAGERRKAWMFLMRLMYSGKDVAWLYDRCDQLALLDGHVRAFAHLGGVPARLVYDNMTLAVKRILLGQRELTHAFRRLMSHYVFEACFTRPGTGHDKGGVEARGRQVRLQHLVPIPRAGTLSAISQELLDGLVRREAARCDRAGRSVSERFAEEAPRLKPLPAVALDIRRPVPVEVSSRSLVEVAGATYSVPSTWARLDAMAYVGVEQVTVACCGERRDYPRQPRGGKVVQYRNYLRELARKPNAVRQVAPDLVTELGEPFGRFWSLLEQTHGANRAARVFAAILGAIVKHGEEPVRTALAGVVSVGERDLLTLLNRLQPSNGRRRIEVPEELATYEIDSAQARDYDHLLAVGGER